MRTYYPSLWLVILLLSVLPASGQQARHVPADYATIQAALDAAAAGDTVLVAPGRYAEALVWPDVHGIKMLSAGDTSNTTLTVEGVGTVLTFTSSEVDTATVVSGFRITGGRGVNGGGIACLSAGPTLRGLRIEDNTAEMYGGGIYVRDGRPYFVDVVAAGNTSREGGGLYLLRGSPTIENLTLTRNTAYLQGGGAVIQDSNPTVEGLVATYNKAVIRGGGGLLMIRGNPTMADLVVAGNAAREGGGLKIENGILRLERATVANNTASLGSGLAISGGIATFNYLTFANNHGAGEGACIDVSDNAVASISHSNFIQNHLAVATRNGVASASANWWGDATGPYHPLFSPAGRGDTTQATVKVLPFLESPELLAPPLPASGLQVIREGDRLRLFWDQSPMEDLMGYRVYYAADSTAFSRAQSIDVHFATQHTLNGFPEKERVYLAVTTYDIDSAESWFSPAVASGGPVNTDVDEPAVLPEAYRLLPNYPNPFNPQTTLTFHLAAPGVVSLSVFDLLGREVARLVDGHRAAGVHSVRWNAANRPGGLYLYRLRAGGHILTRYMTLVK